MKNALLIWLSVFIAEINGFSQVKFQTVAEKTDFKSTSTYNDILTNIDQLKALSSYIRVEYIATSVEGKKIPLLILADPLPGSPEELANDKRIVVYIQANIHAGEVEGKEAAIMYARDLLSDKKSGVLKNVILLICPVFNPDGNDKISPLNRTYQNGPVNGVGIRYNGQSLDLNRDALKAESPEVKGVIENVFNRWDPAVFMDCHTTDGSYHVEPVTFTWAVNPNGDTSLISYLQHKMMPEMSHTLYDKYKVENCFYGEFYDMMNPENGWVFDAAEPRYMTNYFGIRNRLGILNENYVYADFKSRVFGCYFLMHSLLDYSASHKSEIKDLINNVDKTTIARGMHPAVVDSFATELKVKAAPELVTIRTYEADLVSTNNGRKSYKKSDRQKNVTIPYYVDYYPSKSVKFPFAYLISVNDPEIISLLKLHGIKVEKLAIPTKIDVERYEISDLKATERLNQGHYTNTIKGSYKHESLLFPSGTLVVRTSQKLANLAAYLLEPESGEGLTTWNFLDRYLEPQWGIGYNQFPVYKILNYINIETIPVW